VAKHPGDRLVLAVGQAATRREALHVLFARFGRLRVTPVFAALVVLVWTLLLVVSPAVWNDVVHANSTNVANLLDGRVYTLLSSAVVLGDTPDVLGVLAMVVVLGIAELTWGWLRMAGVFLFGHIIATLVVFAGLATGITLHRLGGDLATVSDVGISYGTVAVLGALMVYLPLRHRLRWQILATAVGVAGVVLLHDFTSVGHLISLLLGFGAGYALRRGLVRRLGVPVAAAAAAAAQAVSSPFAKSPAPVSHR
jgi:hypothetical protein